MNGKFQSAKILLAATAVTILIAWFPGCMWAPELAQLRGEIERQLPGAQFDKEFALSLGPLSLGVARLVTRMVPDASDARGYLGDISRVQVAVYNTRRMPSVADVRMPERLSKLQNDNWELAVKVREDDEVVWVMYRIDNERIKDLYVIVLNDEELVMVKAQGHLERLVARAMSDADEKGNFRQIGHTFHDEFDG